MVMLRILPDRLLPQLSQPFLAAQQGPLQHAGVALCASLGLAF
jgi:hypothetical protein